MPEGGAAFCPRIPVAAPLREALVPGWSTKAYSGSARQRLSRASRCRGSRTTTVPRALARSNASSPEPSSFPSSVASGDIGASFLSSRSFASLSSRAPRRCSAHNALAPRTIIVAARISPIFARPRLRVSRSVAKACGSTPTRDSGVRYPASYSALARAAPIPGICVRHKISSLAPAEILSCSRVTSTSTSPHPIGPHTAATCPAYRDAASCSCARCPRRRRRRP